METLIASLQCKQNIQDASSGPWLQPRARCPLSAVCSQNTAQHSWQQSTEDSIVGPHRNETLLPLHLVLRDIDNI